MNVNVHCDRCETVYLWLDGYKARHKWDYIIYANRKKVHFEFNFCPSCVKEVTPLVFRLRDIDELRSSVNKLERVIREKSQIAGNSYNRATSLRVGKRSTGRFERHIGN